MTCVMLQISCEAWIRIEGYHTSNIFYKLDLDIDSCISWIFNLDSFILNLLQITLYMVNIAIEKYTIHIITNQ